MRRLRGLPRLRSGVGVFAGQFAKTSQLGLQLAGFLFQLQDPADSGQVQPVGSQRTDFLERRPMSRRE